MELMTNLVKYKAKSKRPKKLLRAEASILMWLLGILVKSIPCVKSASIGEFSYQVGIYDCINMPKNP